MTSRETVEVPCSGISKEDLLAFHEQHIGRIDSDNVGFPQAVTVKADVVVQTVPQTVPRYSDGTVRRLTDDQIAWFRAQESYKQKAQALRISHEEEPRFSNRFSVEETPANVPIPSDNRDYEDLFGAFKEYHVQLDNSMDKAFSKVVGESKEPIHYYPVLPLDLH